jgi:hypothetical protein
MTLPRVAGPPAAPAAPAPVGPNPDQGLGRGASPGSVTDPAAREVRGRGTAKGFEPWPSYEEERLGGQQGEARQEEALLRQIFEDNLRLREELGRLPA